MFFDVSIYDCAVLIILHASGHRRARLRQELPTRGAARAALDFPSARPAALLHWPSRRSAAFEAQDLLYRHRVRRRPKTAPGRAIGLIPRERRKIFDVISTRGPRRASRPPNEPLHARLDFATGGKHFWKRSTVRYHDATAISTPARGHCGAVAILPCCLRRDDFHHGRREKSPAAASAYDAI